MVTDSELVVRAQSGDQRAMSELYERYFDPVYDFLSRLLRDRSEAADVAQDTFIKAIGGLGGLTSGASFKSWLFTIARNAALNRLETAGRVRPLDEDAAGEEDAGIRFDVVDPSRFANPEEAYEAERLASLVWEAARGMEPKQYSVLDLNVRQGFSSAEIAEVLGVTKNNAYVMVNRMKKTLEEAIGALALFRQPFRRCRELEQLLAGFDADRITPEIRRAIDRHTAGCAVCNEQRRALASPFAILGGLVPLRLAAAAKARIDDAVLVSYREAYPAPTGAWPVPPMPPPDELPEPVSDDLLEALTLRAEAVEAEVRTANARSRRSLAVLGLFVLLLLGGTAIVAAQLGLLSAASEEPTLGADGGSASPSTVGSTPSPSQAAAPESSAPALAGHSGSPSPLVTPALTPSVQATPTPAPTPTPTPRPTPTPTPRPKPTPTPRPTPTPTPSPTPRPTPTPTPTPTPCSQSLTAAPNPLVFGASATSRVLTITATSCPGPVPFTIEWDQRWLRATPRTATPQNGVPFTVDVVVIRSRLSPGLNVGHLTITSGSSSILVTVEAID